MDVHLSNGMTNCQPLQNIISHCILYGLRRPNCHHGKMLGSTSFHILWTFKSVFSPCPYGIVVVVFHFDLGGRKAKKTSCRGGEGFPSIFFCTITAKSWQLWKSSADGCWATWLASIPRKDFQWTMRPSFSRNCSDFQDLVSRCGVQCSLACPRQWLQLWGGMKSKNVNLHVIKQFLCCRT